MSEIIVEDPIWQAILSDPGLARARSKLSFHELRMIIRHAQSPSPSVGDGIERLIGGVILDVCELPDRTSPEDWPEALLVTVDELDGILRKHLAALIQKDSSS